MKRSLLISTLLMFVSALIAQPTLVKGNLNDNLNLNESSNPSNFVNMGNKTYFTANGPTNDIGLYVSNGTEGGTSLVKQLNSSVSNLINSGNSLFFIYENSSIFISDGTKEGTKPFAKFRSVSKMVDNSGTVYFTADDQIHGLELWKTDGTTTGTKLIKDIAYGLPSSQITNWKALGNKLVFFANDGINGIEPWITDGTEAGTKMIKNINQSGGIMENASEMSLFKVNDYIIFAANDGINGTELWRYKWDT